MLQVNIGRALNRTNLNRIISAKWLSILKLNSTATSHLAVCDKSAYKPVGREHRFQRLIYGQDLSHLLSRFYE